MFDPIEVRTTGEGEYIADCGATVRQAAERFGVSKSTVFKDVTERLPGLDMALYERARAVLKINKAERHLRGGFATRAKFQKNGKKRQGIKTRIL